MHQPDQQSPPTEAMRMDVRRATTRHGFAGTTMGVEMRMVAVAVTLEMDAVAPKLPQHMYAEHDQHESDHGFDSIRERRGDDLAEQQRRAGKCKQRQAVAKAPGEAMPDDIADLAAASRDAGDGGNMVGLEPCCKPNRNPNDKIASIPRPTSQSEPSAGGKLPAAPSLLFTPYHIGLTNIRVRSGTAAHGRA
jgi:hypothetical protein